VCVCMCVWICERKIERERGWGTFVYRKRLLEREIQKRREREEKMRPFWAYVGMTRWIKPRERESEKREKEREREHMLKWTNFYRDAMFCAHYM